MLLVTKGQWDGTRFESGRRIRGGGLKKVWKVESNGSHKQLCETGDAGSFEAVTCWPFEDGSGQDRSQVLGIK